MMNIRMIENRDIPVLLDWYNWYIVNTAISFEWEPLVLTDFTERVHRIRKDYPWLVLENEDQTLVGYAYLSAFHERKAYAYTADVSIYLNPKEQGKGYGTILMQALEEIARKDGYHQLVSIITSENTNSVSFHQKQGFKVIGTFENVGYKFNRWYGVTYMAKEINSAYTDAEPTIRNVDWNNNL